MASFKLTKFKSRKTKPNSQVHLSEYKNKTQKKKKNNKKKTKKKKTNNTKKNQSSCATALYKPFKHSLTHCAIPFALYIPNERIMKKHIMIPVVAAVVLLAAWTKPLIEKITTEKTVSNSVSFAVYK